MFSEINNTKEVIKNRMLKHALTYWGIKNTEDLDPAIKLILEALSVELYNLGNEVKDTQVRVLEKVASLLAPDFLTSPNPAHAILYACPVEPTEVLTNSTAFFAQRKIAIKQNDVPDTAIDLFFTPVDAVKLFDVQINTIATGGSLYSYDASFNRQLVVRSRNRQADINTLWLGLKANTKIDGLDGLFFYFDWKNLESKLANRIYQLLPLAKWFINDKEITVKPGIGYQQPTNGIDSYEHIFLEYDLLTLMEKDIKHYYGKRLVTISDDRLANIETLRQVYPASFKKQFTENELQKMNEPLLWVKIVFPAAMQQEFLDEVNIYPNAFPVMNRKINDLKYRLKGGSNIIPLKTGALDQFLTVKTLADEQNRYRSVPYRKMEEEESGNYTLRNGGVERFDNRNARELISYLLELLRSESAAFSAYGYDFIATTLKEMNQKIALMEQKTKGYVNNAAEVPNYIIVKPYEGHDMMYAEYWTTLAEIANNLRAGSRLQLVKGVKVKADSIVLMTTTIGGRNRLKPEERLNAFRYGIMTRDRIVTKEDIRNFCFYELGERISDVDVQRGVEMSAHNKEAFRRTIDVILTPGDDEAMDKEEWTTLSEQLKSKLQVRSGMSNYYRVKVNV